MVPVLHVQPLWQTNFFPSAPRGGAVVPNFFVFIKTLIFIKTKVKQEDNNQTPKKQYNIVTAFVASIDTNREMAL